MEALKHRLITRTIKLPNSSAAGITSPTIDVKGWTMVHGYYFLKIKDGGITEGQTFVGLSTGGIIIQEPTTVSHYLVGQNVGIDYRFCTNDFAITSADIDIVLDTKANLTTDLEYQIILKVSK
jgi:hypothetical protein